MDFGTLLALTYAVGPSVVLLRSEEVRPEQMQSRILGVLQTFSSSLLEGALVVIDVYKTRVRMLPLQRQN